jgi:hypothetical protein
MHIHYVIKSVLDRAKVKCDNNVVFVEINLCDNSAACKHAMQGSQF